jgi:polysaccharide export outer membrane protein
MKLKILLILIFPAFFFSCMTPPKNFVYFQDIDKYQQNLRIANDSASYDPVIKRNDELLITVSAPVLDQTTVAQFNLPPIAYMTSGETDLQKSPTIQTYIVDNNGKINFPIIGELTMAELTKSQAIELLKKSISNYVNDPIINLRIISSRIIILGEVRAPGPHYFRPEKMSILDAIADAGDITSYGNRNNILLIRENDNGTINHIRLDLTSPDLFSSPYFYLQQNDKIYVEPNKAKQMESKFGVADGYKLSVISMVFGVISIIASTTIAIISIKNK